MRVVLTDYHSGDHRPYVFKMRDPITDEDFGRFPDAMVKAVVASGAVDGDEVEIVIRKTGRRPFGDRKVVWVAPHTYEREKP